MSRWSLKAKAIVLISGVVLTLIVLLLGLLSLQIRSEASRAVAAEVNRTWRTFNREQRQKQAALQAQGRVIAHVAVLGAALTTHDPATVSQVTQDYRSLLGLDLYIATDDRGRPLAALRPGGRASDPASQRLPAEAVTAALRRREVTGFFGDGRDLYQVAVLPVVIGGETRGTLTVGSQVNDALASALKATTDSEVSFVVDGRLIASTLDRATRARLVDWLAREPRAGGGPALFHDERVGDLVTETAPLPTIGGGRAGFIVVQQSLTQAVSSYNRLLTGLGLAGLAALLVAIFISIWLAESVTGPILAIAHAAQELSFGQWDRRVAIRSKDELRDLAEAFNRMADRLQRWDVELREEVERRTHELNAAVAKLDHAYQRMREFNADAAHDLLTPFTIMRGEIEVALRSEREPSEYRRVLRTVLDETMRLARIVDQLLVLARADAGEAQIVRGPVELADLLRGVTAQLAGAAAGRRVDVELDPGPDLTVEGDRDRLHQLFFNLVDNAIKYSQPGGGVRVRWLRRADNACIEVADTGSGIAPEHVPRLFDRFYRVDRARSRSMGGSGLGLAICKWIVEAHQGSIAVESRLDVGSTFRIVLPLRDATPRAAAPDRATPSSEPLPAAND